MFIINHAATLKVEPGPLIKPACSSCKGFFYQMDVVPPAPTPGPAPAPAAPNRARFGNWSTPAIVESGVAAHQLYSQITWRFYDIFLGIVMTFDAEDGSVGPDAGHVHGVRV
jgi:hypothetical protein